MVCCCDGTTMTESVAVSEISKTALPAGLKSAGFNSQLASYLGALSPVHLDAPERETAALLTEVAVHDLGWQRRIAVRGEDRFRWLSGMVTNGVETLAEIGECGSGAYNLVLNAQGRIQGDCNVWRTGDELELEVTAAQAEALLAHFDKFIIMDDVELIPVAGESALGLTGPLVDSILTAVGLPILGAALTNATGAMVVEGAEVGVQLYRGFGTVVPHYELWVETARIMDLWEALTAAGATPVGFAALETLRVVEGIPAYGVDIQSRDLAQETSQDRALSFTKGCYLGQEIVERVRSRGQVHRHLRHLELTPEENSIAPPAAGIELKVAGNAPESKPAGMISSMAEVMFGGMRRVFAIGMVRAEAELGNQALVYDGGTAKILTITPKF